MQALETVPGINAVSEGHADRAGHPRPGARPDAAADRRRARELGAPRRAERDVRGPGDVRRHRRRARPGIGGLRIRRARRRHLGAHPPRRAGQSAARPGQRHASAAASPIGAAASRSRRGCDAAASSSRRTRASADDWDSPVDDAEILNSGWEDGGFIARVDHQLGTGVLSAGWQSDFGRDIERPRNNSQTVRFYYPYENSHRFTSSYEIGRRRPASAVRRSPASSARSNSAPTRIASPPPRPAAASSAPTSRPTTSTSRPARAAALGRRALEFGVDVNGRFGLEAIDTIQRYDLAGALTDARPTTCRSMTRSRTDTGAYVQADCAVASMVCGSRRACAPTTSRPATSAATSAIATSQRGVLGFRLRRPSARSSGFSLTGAGLARLPRSDALGPLLPRPVRPRLHHRQSRPRAGDEPAVRSRRALRDRPDAARRATSTTTGSTTSSSATRPRPTSSSSATAAAAAVARLRARGADGPRLRASRSRPA